MKKYFPPIFLILISVLPLAPLFSSNLFLGHDTESHIARLVAFYTSLSEGNLIPRWAGNLNLGYGHPVLMFLYPLTNYLGSFFHLLGFSFINSVRLVFIVSFIASGLTMYLFVKEIWGKTAGMLSAVIYLLSPYRFVDLYIRAALGEHLAFVFLPLVLWSFYKLSKNLNSQNLILSSTSLALLILSHNAISLIFMPFFIIYLLVLIKENKFSRAITIYFIICFFLGFSLSAFFWLPAFYEGKYTLRDILTDKEILNRLISFRRLFNFSWNFGGSETLPVQIGIINLLTLIFFPIFLFLKKKIKYQFIFILSFLFCILYLFLTIEPSRFIWEKVTLIQKFQFPWRFLSGVVLFTSLLTIPIIASLKGKIRFLIASSIIFFALIFSSPQWKTAGYLTKTDAYFIKDYQGTTDTGESSPIWSIRGMEAPPKAPLEVIEGNAKYKTLNRQTNKHEYKISAKSKTRLVDNTLYFPGWKVYVDGRETNIEFQDINYRGLITFWVNKGNHEVKIIFHETKLRIFSNYLSLLSIFIVILIAFKSRLPKKS